MTVTDLRQRYPKFVYRSFTSQVTPVGLEMKFLYEAAPDLAFNHQVIIPGISQEQLSGLAPERLQSYVFHLGLFEMFNYWKATCSPEVLIEAGALTPEQLTWWHQLLLKGMGEYFYVNQIDFTVPNFVQITCSTPATSSVFSDTLQLPDHLNLLFVPLGGGKDSVVTAQLLLQERAQNPDLTLTSLLVNPTQAAQDITTQTGLMPAQQITRTLDPLLFDLNQRGYLNGHVPFSAIVAWISIFAAELKGMQGIAVSNERSSNEGNVCYKDVEINHQFSKTYEFERSLQLYCQNYFPGAPLYFSFLRPLYELQIARLFAHLTESEPAHQLRHLFRSCNRGQKTNSWCGECSKCLFAYTILSPFISQTELQQLFGKNILDDIELWPIALDLLGKGENKPLECVGTYEESLFAFYLSKQRLLTDTTPLPALLAKIDQEILAQEKNLEERAHTLLTSWGEEHSLPSDLAQLLKSAVS